MIAATVSLCPCCNAERSLFTQLTHNWLSNLVWSGWMICHAHTVVGYNAHPRQGVGHPSQMSIFLLSRHYSQIQCCTSAFVHMIVCDAALVKLQRMCACDKYIQYVKPKYVKMYTCPYTQPIHLNYSTQKSNKQFTWPYKWMVHYFTCVEWCLCYTFIKSGCCYEY